MHFFLSILFSAAAAALLASSPQYPAFVLTATTLLAVAPTDAAGLDKEDEVKSILQQMETDVLALRDEMERVYSSRCLTSTLTECYGSNFNGCWSTFPASQCMEAEELVVSACGDGERCNALWDKTTSSVSIPASLATAPFGNPSDPEIVETTCFTRLAEDYMAEKYKSDEAFWAKYNVQPSWTYFGAHNGLFRKIPATHQEECGQYDPRRRPWFVAASSGPKDVVLVVDVSGSMNDYDRINIAKKAAITVVDTLTVGDRVAVISFSSTASQIGGHSSLVRATSENKKQLIQAINGLDANGATNFYAAFYRAFDALDKTIQTESTSGCNIAVLFMTDGQISEGPGEDKVISLVNERVEQLAANYNRKTTIFTFSLGQAADHTVTKQIACNTSGIWTSVDDLTGDLVSAMSGYYRLFALGLGEGGNDNFTAWVEPYEFSNPKGKMGTTVSVPVFDRSVSPPLFLGVAAVDLYMDAFEKILGEDAMSSTMLDRFVRQSTALCPAIELTECELDALRFLAGGEDGMCGVCNSTNGSSRPQLGVVPEKCPFTSDLPNNLWQNTDLEGYEYKNRTCCETGGTAPSSSCSSENAFDDDDGGEAFDEDDGSAVAGIIIVVCVLAGICLCGGCCYVFFKVVNRPRVEINYSMPAAASQPAVVQPVAVQPPTVQPMVSAQPVSYGNQMGPQVNLGAAYNPSAPPVNPMYNARA